MQILVSAARQLLLDRLELKQQIVSEGPDQPQPRIVRMPELLDQRAQNRKRRGLLAALLLREQRRQRPQLSLERRSFSSKRLPVRMPLQHALEHGAQLLAARIQRPELHIAP